MDDTSPNPMTAADKDAPPAETKFEPAEPLKDEHVKFEVDDGASDEKSDAKPSGGGGLTAQATDKARQFVGQGKDKTTDALGQLAQILAEAAGQVEQKLGSTYGQYAHQAAGGVQGFADQLRDKDVDELLDDVRALIRKSPGVAVGAAATIGFVLTRLVSAGFDQRQA